MLLDDLVACIESLQERIRSHGSSLRANETRTRMALIDPLLQVLGWDVSDPDVVTPEYDVSGARADYALLRPGGKPAATVEAKRLGEALESHRMQMLNYANASGIDYAGLTDGDRWELYAVFERGQLADRRILDVSIATGPAHELALKLLLLWRPNLASGRQPTPASTPILGDAPPPQAAKPAAVEATPAPRPPGSGWVALSEYNPPTRTPCPAAIRFWDSSERSLTRWYELAISVAEKLYADGRFTVADMPIAGGGARYSVHTEPVHRTGKPFESYKHIDGTPPLYVDTWLSASQARAGAKRLLRAYGVNPANVHLKVAQ